MRKLALTTVLMVFVSGCTQIPTGAFLPEDGECFPMWNCVDWSDCVLDDGRWVQTRTCTDANVCGVETNRPTAIQDCEPPSIYEANLEETVSQCGFDIMLDSVKKSKDIVYTGSNGDPAPLILTSDEYLVVPYVVITNNFNHSVRVSFTDFILEDQNEIIYTARCPNRTENDFVSCQEGDEWHLGSKYIQTSEKIERNLIFFVPDTSTNLKLYYSMPINLLNYYNCNIAGRIAWNL
jgi:hypothetical protein